MPKAAQSGALKIGSHENGRVGWLNGEYNTSGRETGLN
jgi:hypothetical protein